MKTYYRELVREILREYSLPLHGCHGIAHWARVFENGQRLTNETGAQLKVVSLFAILHDSKRENEFTDPEHGLRAAEYARSLRGIYFDLDESEFNLLYRACEGHTHERTHPNITIQTCWDADRLDLGRVGILPVPERLCTEVAKRPETIQWADERASLDFMPGFIRNEWGVDLKDSFIS